MKKTIALLPLFALAACAEIIEIDNATCYVDATNPDNISAEVRLNTTNGLIVKADNLILMESGMLRGENPDSLIRDRTAMDHHMNKDGVFSVKFDEKTCGFSPSPGFFYKVKLYKYPMELTGVVPTPK